MLPGRADKKVRGRPKFAGLFQQQVAAGLGVVVVRRLERFDQVRIVEQSVDGFGVDQLHASWLVAGVVRIIAENPESLFQCPSTLASRSWLSGVPPRSH